MDIKKDLSSDLRKGLANFLDVIMQMFSYSDARVSSFDDNDSYTYIFLQKFS